MIKIDDNTVTAIGLALGANLSYAHSTGRYFVKGIGIYLEAVKRAEAEAAAKDPPAKEPVADNVLDSMVDLFREKMGWHTTPSLMKKAEYREAIRAVLVYFEKLQFRPRVRDAGAWTGVRGLAEAQDVCERRPRPLPGLATRWFDTVDKEEGVVIEAKYDRPIPHVVISWARSCSVIHANPNEFGPGKRFVPLK